MLTFLKRERSLRMLPVTALGAFVLMVLLFPITAAFDVEPIRAVADTASSADEVVDQKGRASSTNSQVAYLILMLATLEMVLIVSLRFLPVRVRVREFERALPATMRRIVLERTAAMWLALAAPLVAASLVWIGRFPAPGEVTTYGYVVGRALSAITLAVLVLASYRPAAPELNWVEVLVLGAVAVAIAVAPGALESTALDLVYVALIVGLAAFLWRALPAGSPAADPRVAAQPTGAATANLAVRLFGPLRWTMLRSTVLRPPILILSLAGAAFLSFAADGSPFFLLWFPAMVITGAFRMGLNTLHGLDALPVRRERLLRVVGLPTLGLLALSFGGAALVERDLLSFRAVAWGVSVDRHSEESWSVHGEYRTHVKVPPRLWQLASRSEDARVTAPWGETMDPMPHPLYQGTQTFAHNPYDVVPENSGRFFVWQVARALRDVHGFDGSADEVHAAWFPELDLDAPIADARIADVTSEAWGFDVLRRSSVPNAVGFAMLGATLLWFALALFVLRPNVPSKSGATWVRWARSDVAGIVLFSFVVLFAVVIQGNDRELPAILSARLNLWLDGALGSSPYLWSALVLGLAGAGYAVLAWRIQRIEVPPLAVNGWTKKAMPIY